VLVLLDHSGSKNDQRTFTDLRGNFEFRNVPQGPYKAPTTFAFACKASNT